MTGSDRMNPARLVLPASALVLAGMAWRMGWIDGSVLEPAIVVILLFVGLSFVALVVGSIPILIVSGVLMLGSGAVRRFWPKALPARGPPGEPSP